MPVDYSDVLKQREALEARSLQRRSPADALGLTTQRVIGLRMEELLASDDWGVYRQHLQGLVEADRQALAAISESILSYHSVGEHLVLLKFQASTLRGRIAAFEEALALPEHLKKTAEEAVKTLTSETKTP